MYTRWSLIKCMCEQTRGLLTVHVGEWHSAFTVIVFIYILNVFPLSLSLVHSIVLILSSALSLSLTCTHSFIPSHTHSFKKMTPHSPIHSHTHSQHNTMRAHSFLVTPSTQLSTYTLHTSNIGKKLSQLKPIILIGIPYKLPCTFLLIKM